MLFFGEPLHHEMKKWNKKQAKIKLSREHHWSHKGHAHKRFFLDAHNWLVSIKRRVYPAWPATHIAMQAAGREMKPENKDAEPFIKPKSTIIPRIFVQSIFAKKPTSSVMTTTIKKISTESSPVIQVIIAQPRSENPGRAKAIELWVNRERMVAISNFSWVVIETVRSLRWFFMLFFLSGKWFRLKIFL